MIGRPRFLKSLTMKPTHPRPHSCLCHPLPRSWPQGRSPWPWLPLGAQPQPGARLGAGVACIRTLPRDASLERDTAPRPPVGPCSWLHRLPQLLWGGASSPRPGAGSPSPWGERESSGLGKSSGLGEASTRPTVGATPGPHGPLGDGHVM